MKRDIQQNIASSQLTLPIVAVICGALWLVLPWSPAHNLTETTGVFTLLPQDFFGNWTGRTVAMAIAAIVVYAMTELNNAFSLLRITSRMLATTLMVLMLPALQLHTFGTELIVLAFTLLSFFPLLACYQTPSPRLAFYSALCISLASILSPVTVVLIPIQWICMIMLRAFTLRMLIASLLALLFPYWSIAGMVVITGSYDILSLFRDEMANIQMFDYDCIHFNDIILLCYEVLFFLVGMVDFIIKYYRDKTRTRVFYTMFIVLGWLLLGITALIPGNISCLTAIFLIPTAVLSGHFFALSGGRISHIICIVLLVLTAIATTITSLF